MRYPPLSPSEKAAIIRLYEQPGQNLVSVAQTSRCGSKLVRKVLLESGAAIKSHSESNTRFPISPELEARVLAMYPANTQTAISIELKVPASVVHKILKRNKVTFLERHEFGRSFTDVDDFFAVIDSHEKAHVLGFIFADGYIQEEFNRVEIKLSAKDTDYLEEIRKRIAPERQLKLYPHVGSIGMIHLSLTSREMVSDLRRYGLHQAKSLTMTWPTNIPPEFINSFVLGYFDGDGCITRNEIGDYRLEMLGTEHFLAGIASYLNPFLKRPLCVCQKGKTRIHQIQFGGNIQIAKVCAWMYRDSTLFLSRKRSRYNELTELMATRHR